jgi:hypothetical protein
LIQCIETQDEYVSWDKSKKHCRNPRSHSQSRMLKNNRTPYIQRQSEGMMSTQNLQPKKYQRSWSGTIHKLDWIWWNMKYRRWVRSVLANHHRNDEPKGR